VLCGIAYNGNEKWDSVVAAKIEGELLIHPKDKMEYWNCGVIIIIRGLNMVEELRLLPCLFGGRIEKFSFEVRHR
jgi:hypothetical protein